MIRQWLRAGVVENGRLTRTEEGTPQGGVISPVLLNIALHGMETVVGVRYRASGSVRVDSPVTIRYADDFVVHLLATPGRMRSRSKRGLPGGLSRGVSAFNEDKTRVVSLAEGFDFLGCNVRRYGTKPLIKPSKTAGETDPGTAPRRAAVPAREQRHRGDQTPEPDHPGDGRPITGHRSPARSSDCWITTSGSSPTSGRSSATTTSRAPGRSAGTSASSTSPAKTGGCSATAIAAATSTASAGRALSGTSASSTERHPTTPRLPSTGHGAPARSPCRSTTPACGSTESRKAAA